MIGRALAVWSVLVVLAIANGAAREALVTPRFGPDAGHVISSISLSAVILLVAWLTAAWMRIHTARDAWIAGTLWLGATVGFEFLAGHYLFGNPWEQLLADYDLLRGRIWVLVLLVTFAAPRLALGALRTAPS